MLDILYLSWNRPEFTRLTLELLGRNTDWGAVDRLVIYDDGSELESLAALEAQIGLLEIDPERVVYRQTEFGSPPAVMDHYLRNDPAELFVKVDNDIAVPPLWLEKLLSVWNDQIDLLGFEIGMPHGINIGMDLELGSHAFVPARHIGGVGMMRTEAFKTCAHRMRPDGRFGFTEWQHMNKPVRGWIFPEITAPCLDRLPVEPWVSLSQRYESLGWQRSWWKYPLDGWRYWEWFTKEEAPV